MLESLIAKLFDTAISFKPASQKEAEKTEKPSKNGKSSKVHKEPVKSKTTVDKSRGVEASSMGTDLSNPSQPKKESTFEDSMGITKDSRGTTNNSKEDLATRVTTAYFDDTDLSDLPEEKLKRNPYLILEGNEGIVFLNRDKLHMKRFKWVYGKRFRNM